MKWVMFIAAVLVIPVLGVGARSAPMMRRWLARGLGFLPFVAVDINLISYEHYRGDARGLEISLVDLIAVALSLALPRAGSRGGTPLLHGVYLAVALGSASSAPLPLFVAFGVWKLVRLLYLAKVARKATAAGLAPPLYEGLAAGLVYAAALALKQRYVDGVLQAAGPFSHQNGLGLAANLIYPALLALILEGAAGRLEVAAILSAGLAVVLSLSRGGLAMTVLAGVVVFGVSYAQRPTRRKRQVLALGLAGLVPVLAKAGDTIVERFLHAPRASAEGRHLFEEAAALMLHDHPLGVGLNQYSHVQSDHGYADAIGIPAVDRDGIVHNIYRLTAAELGWPGVLVYGLVLWLPVVLGARAVLRLHAGPVRALVLGLTVSLGVTAIHGLLEWSLRTTQISQLMWLEVGLLGAVIRASRRSRNETAPPIDAPAGVSP